MKIRGKLFLGFFLVLGITIFIALFGAFNLRQVDAQYSYALSFPMERYILLSELGVLFMDARRTTNRAALYMSDPDDPVGGINVQEMGIFRLRNEIDARLARFRINVNADPMLDIAQKLERMEAVTGFESHMHRYFNYYIQGLLNAARRFDEVEAIRLVREGVATVNAALEYYDFLNDTAREFMETISAELTAQTSRTFLMILGVALAGVVIGVSIAMAISGMVTKPVVLLSGGLDDVAKGDLTRRLP